MLSIKFPTLRETFLEFFLSKLKIFLETCEFYTLRETFEGEKLNVPTAETPGETKF